MPVLKLFHSQNTPLKKIKQIFGERYDSGCAHMSKRCQGDTETGFAMS